MGNVPSVVWPPGDESEKIRDLDRQNNELLQEMKSKDETIENITDQMHVYENQTQQISYIEQVLQEQVKGLHKLQHEVRYKGMAILKLREEMQSQGLQFSKDKQEYVERFRELGDEIAGLRYHLQRTDRTVRALQDTINEEWEFVEEYSTMQRLLEKISPRVVIAVLVGGGIILLGAYIIKKKYFPSENSFLLPDPWRKIHPTETDISTIKGFYLRKIVEICSHQDRKLNILLLGQSGSGKSSFINSCQTALGQNGTISRVATVFEDSLGSVTKHLQAYGLELRDGDGKLRLPVRLFDCRGLLDENRGVQTKDIISICDGHIKNQYEIQPKTPITPDDPKYRANPEVEDKIHCVVYVIDAQNGDNFVRERVKEQFEEVKKHLLKSAISTPQLILLTKIDRLGVRHLDKTFYDKRVKECCEMASSFFGFPLGDVLPQASYSEEVIPTEERDLITLFNIYKAMKRAKEYAQQARNAVSTLYQR